MPEPRRATRSPLLTRTRWHLRRIRQRTDRRVVAQVGGVLLAIVLGAAGIVTLVEKPLTVDSFMASVYWAVNTILGSGDPSYATSAIGWLVNWLLIILGLTLLAMATGLVIGFFVDVLLKEGQGMGAAGYRNHIVICGWSPSARELVGELCGDKGHGQVVVLHGADKNPAGRGVYFINGDPTDPEDLERAGIREAAAAIVFPSNPTDDADMRSILTVMAIEQMAPEVRTIVEVNNPRHVGHLQRAHADEVLAPTQLTAHLLARTSLYPGLGALVTDLVSGGEGSELYRVQLPEGLAGTSAAQAAARLRAEHGAVLLAITRDGETMVNPPDDVVLQATDEALVVAEDLGELRPAGA